MSAHLLAGLLALALPARATPPTIQPKTLQCGNTYANGTTSNHPNPVLLALLSESTNGIMIGQQPLNSRTGVTVARWDFNSGNTNTITLTSPSPNWLNCNGSWYYIAQDKVYTWTHAQSGQPTLTTGNCSYTYNWDGLVCDYHLIAPQQTPIDASCPADYTTIPVGPTSLTSSGKFGLGLALNGSQWASTPETAAFRLPGSYTLSAWVNTTAAGTQRVLSLQSSGYWGFGLSGTNGLRHFDSRDSSADVTIITGTTFQNTGWHLITVVRTNGVSRRFYVDGVYVGNSPATSASPFGTIGGTVQIGRYEGGSEYFTGTLDDVRVINTNLSDDEVRAEYNATLHRYSGTGATPTTYVQGTYTDNTGLPVGYANGATAVYYKPGEAYSALGRWQVVAVNAATSETTVSSVLSITQDSTPPSATPITAATPLSNSSILWSWPTPTHYCATPTSGNVGYYLHDTVTASTVTSVLNTTSVTETGLAGPNVLVGRRLHVTDYWGSGPLGNAATAYTLANFVSLFPLTSISTGSVLLNWNTNSNPSYTRYGVTYSADGFATTSTRAAIGNDFTGNLIGIGGLLDGTTYTVRLQVFNGRSADTYGGIGSAFDSASFTTRPLAPTITGVAASNSVINWSWNNPRGTAYFNVYSSTGLYYTGGKNTLLANGLGQNVGYQFFVEAVAPSPSGAGAQSSAYVYTLALPPVAPIVPVIGKTSATFSWGANGNPGYTYYEVSVATDAVFGAVITTVTTTGTSLTVNDLFPATTYYARVRALNGDQIYTTYANFTTVVTYPDPFITNNAAPASPYVVVNGLVGQWNFDIQNATTTPDSSGMGNAAVPTCLTANCVSTPTYVAGPSGLGNAMSFSGVTGSLVRVPDSGNYAYADDWTVVAWVRPDSVSQPNGAGIVVRGDGGAEDFALEVSGGLYRYLAKPGFAAASTNTIQTGVWTHLVGVYDDAAGGSAKLYVNGQLASTVGGVGARLSWAHDVSIGNRQSGSTLYDRGFIGRIDGVRLIHRALTAAEALSEYNGNFVSTITPASPNASIQVGLPPNAFGAPAIVYVSADPANHPVKIAPAQLASGLAAGPTGYVLVSGSVVEVVPMVGGSAYTSTLGSSATVVIPYTDADGDEVIDGSSPPLAASRILAFTLNTTVNRWEPLPTVVDRANKRVILWTPHFSVFALYAPAIIGQSLSQVRVYPVPWKPGSGGIFDANGVTFDNLPASGRIRILSLSGERVAEFTFTGVSAGSYVWNGNNDSGRRVASGVYYARITADDGSTALVRFAIER